MKKIIFTTLTLIGFNIFADININKVQADLSKQFSDESIWAKVQGTENISLMGQPMVVPKPKNTETQNVQVAAVHDGKWIAFKMTWKDSEISEAGKLATFSDAVAVQFPSENNETPPPVFMGGKGMPVHIFHWKYEFQQDEEKGKKDITQIYPNMTTDMYQRDFKVKGNYPEATQEEKESFVGGTAAGNPQSFAKTAVDEIFAEGFGTSAVSETKLARGKGYWRNGEWTVYITRPLKYEKGSNLVAGKNSFIGLAVWQGGKNEVGAIKSLTMSWTPIKLLE